MTYFKTTLFAFLCAVFCISFVGLSNPLTASADTLQQILETAAVSSAEQDVVNLPKVDSLNTSAKKTNSIIYTIIEILLILSGIFAVVLIVMGGIEYTISAGEEDRLNGGKAKIKYALIGLIAIIFSYAILTNVVQFISIAEESNVL